MKRSSFFVTEVALIFGSSVAVAQEASARTVQYHSQDIVPIHAKLKYTTLIEVPPSEKIMEAATGDKEFWVVDVVGNFCFVHPAKAGISSNLNLITDKGNIYSFTLQDISDSSTVPDLKVLVQPVDRTSIVASSGPPQFVPAAQLEQSREQVAAVQAHITQMVDEYKSGYPLALKFDYSELRQAKKEGQDATAN
jgi:type IV secretion system protein VirB9